MQDKTAVVLTYGTFDLFHIGHLRLLERARSLGSQLHVGVSSDEFNTIKGKRTVIPYDQRAAIVGALACVDEVFPEHRWDQKTDDILRVKASKLVMGDDWAGKFDNLGAICEIVYLPRTKGVSSTELKSALRVFHGRKIDELLRGLDALRDIVRQIEN